MLVRQEGRAGLRCFDILELLLCAVPIACSDLHHEVYQEICCLCGNAAVPCQGGSLPVCHKREELARAVWEPGLQPKQTSHSMCPAVDADFALQKLCPSGPSDYVFFHLYIVTRKLLLWVLL